MGAFSRPSEILPAGVASLMDRSLIVATFETLRAAFAGLLVAIMVGVPVGLLIGISPTARLAIFPTVEAFRPVPSVAFIPLSLLVFGFGVSMEAAIVAFACVWSVLIATMDAAKALEGRLAEVARTLEMSPLEYSRKMVLPAALARIAVGVRLAVGVAIVVAVTVEIVVNPSGLGYALVIAQQSLRPDLVYAQLLWVGAVGWTVNWILSSLDRRFLSRFSPGRRST
jgi:NitT/TauT family transport system permease protein